MTFFSEEFDDASFSGRGWYDQSGSPVIDSTVHANGSSASIRFHWAVAATTPPTPHRHLFTASDSVYVSFWMKLGTAAIPWQGSGKPYHPHLIQFLTDADDAFVGPNSALLSVLIETSLFTPRFAAADGAAVNGAFIGQNLLASSTPHAIAGGNGSQNASAQYFSDPPGYSNSTFWDAAAPAFVNDTWHFTAWYIAMNSTAGGFANPDGILQCWVDGVQKINFTNVYLRTGDNPARKFNQLLLAPYIGDGSPIAQDMWIDRLTVADHP